MDKKNRNAESFFIGPVGIAAWKNGKKMFEEYRGRVISVPDGKYEATIVDARFEFGRRTRPFHVLSFELPDKSIIKKAIAFDSSEGVASVMYELSLMGIQLDNPVDIEKAYDKVRSKKQMCIISIKTSGLIRHVVIESYSIRPLDVPLIQTVIVPPPENKSVEAQSAIQEEAISDSGKEIDIVVGSVISYEFQGEVKRGTVIELYEDDFELAVESEDGARSIISGGDVKGLIR